MISVLRLAPMRRERLWTSSGSTVRISIRNVMELTSLLYLRERGREREGKESGGETAAVSYEKISMKEMYLKLNVTSKIPTHQLFTMAFDFIEPPTTV